MLPARPTETEWMLPVRPMEIRVDACRVMYGKQLRACVGIARWVATNACSITRTALKRTPFCASCCRKIHFEQPVAHD